jgi:hypothetical protein
MCILDAMGVSPVMRSVNIQLPTAKSQMNIKYTIFILLLVKILVNMEYEKTEYDSRKAK